MSTHPMRRLAYAAGLVAILPLGACASAGGGDPDLEMTISVVNDRIPSSNISIYIVPDRGIRRLLGNVGAGDTATFSFSATGTQYRLLARTTGGDELLSPLFSAIPPETLRWTLRSNIVAPIRSEGFRPEGAELPRLRAMAQPR
jgi:hypothetical protein